MIRRPLLVLCFCLPVAAGPVSAEVFNILPGDVAGLTDALHVANATTAHDVINISGTYELTTVDNTTDGPNGLPSITSSLTINSEAGATIRRSSATGTPPFRILHVGQTGTLAINRVVITGGVLGESGFGWEELGGGILSLGNVAVTNSVITGNLAFDSGGGIAQIRAGTSFTLRNSIVSANGVTNGASVGGVAACCIVVIVESTISDNVGIGLSIAGVDEHGEFSSEILAQLVNSSVVRNRSVARIAGILAGGNVAIKNSTVAENVALSGGPAAIFLHSGMLSLVNTTVASNTSLAASASAIGGIAADPNNNGRIELRSTILAGNVPSDCDGAAITSGGHNVIGSIMGCNIALHNADLLEDPPALGPLVDDGTAGGGYLPLLATSVAIDAGNDAVCASDPVLATDQLGHARVGPCDIGAIEFQPGGPIVAFAGTPGTPNCHGKSVSALVREFGGLPKAAAARGFDSVQQLQKAIKAFCEK